MSESKSNVFSAELLAHIFQNAAITGIGSDLPAAGTPGSLYITLNTADPTDTGTADDNETDYTDYQRQAVVRSAGGWALTGTDPAIISPVADIDFPECSAVPGTPITHFTVTIAGVKATADKILYSGQVLPNITMAIGVIPRIKTTSTITET
jgi:hypothetical protein